jgi:D-alanyl-D-alanine carboxypeptidase
MRMQPRGLIRALLITAAVAAAGFPGAGRADAATLERSLLDVVGARGGPPGASVLIQRGKRREFIYAGVADVRTRRRAKASDHLRIASVSKGFNAVVALALVENEKRMTLDDTIGTRLPGLLPNGDAVTLRQLLQHTSGLADYIRAPAFIDRFTSDPRAYLSPLDLLGFVRADPLAFPPGSRYQYSDTDNIAAGLMAEAASGHSYERLLRDEIAKPLRLRGTSLPRTVNLPRPYVHGYAVEPGKKPEDVSRQVNPSGAWASGAIVSTPDDLATFAPVYVNAVLDATRGLPGAFRPGSSSPPGPGRNSAGLGLFRYRTRCGTVYGHTGSFPGYRLLVAGNAAGTRSVVFAANAQIVPGRGTDQALNAILRAQTVAVCRALRPNAATGR